MFFLINKPLWLSSFTAIAHLRRKLGIKKIGHTGTLDPLATGLLLVATDNSTKLIPYIDKARKTYVFTVRLDGTSDSLDLGTPVRSLDADTVERAKKSLTLAQISEILESEFTGTIRQIPPVYSALKIEGRRAYDLARGGEEVVMQERTAEIYSACILDFSFPEVTLEMEVSVGTYIRSIARDLARSLGLEWYVTKLHRSRIAHLDESIAAQLDAIDIQDAVSYDQIFPDIASISPGEAVIRQIQSGIKFNDTFGLEAGKVYFAKQGGVYISLIESREGVIRVLSNKIE